MSAVTRRMTIAEILRLKQLDAWQRLCLQQWPTSTVIEVAIHKDRVELLSDAPSK